MSFVNEFCPNCNTENEFTWDVKRDGYKTFCPHCGERLMLCGECNDSGANCDYDKTNDTCRHNLKCYQVLVKETYTKQVYVYAHSVDEAENVAEKLNRHGTFDGMDMKYNDTKCDAIYTSYKPGERDAVYICDV